MKITEYFNLSELAFGATAARCGVVNTYTEAIFCCCAWGSFTISS